MLIEKGNEHPEEFISNQQMWEKILRKCGVLIEHQNTGYEHYPIHRFSEKESWKEGLPPPTLDNLFKYIIPEVMKTYIARFEYTRYQKRHIEGGIAQFRFMMINWIDELLKNEWSKAPELLITACYKALCEEE